MCPFRLTACVPVHQMVSRKKRYELKGQHAPTRRRCSSPSRPRIARSSLRQVAVHRAVSMDFLPPWMASQPGDRHVLAGEWEYADGAVVRLTLGEQGNSHYDWKDGGFETQPLIGHTLHGMWF